MNKNQYFLKKHITILILLFFFFFLYISFPTSNSTADAYSYASSVKYRTELFAPHHLLYNAFNYILYLPLKLAGCQVGALGFMKVLNAFFATLSLLILYMILIHIPALKRTHIYILIFFAGNSFATLRYATEAETYIIPVFFSLTGSYFYIKYIYLSSRPIYLFFSGVFASIACLFHQEHFFWWFGLLVSLLLYFPNWKSVVFYIFPAFIVPLAYLSVVIEVENQEASISNLLHFIFYEYVSGSLESSIGWKNFFLTGVSLFRTFFQVHGKCIYLLRQFPMLCISVFITIILMINAVFPLRKFYKISSTSPVFKTHSFILVLQLFFAFYAVGNAEFMVMIPFLICLLLPYFSISYTKVLFLAVGMFAWNLSFGIVPDSMINYSNDVMVLKKVELEKNHLFILNNGLTLTHLYHYMYGRYPDNVEIKFTGNIDGRKRSIAKHISEGHSIYTDLGKNTSVMSRSALLERNAYTQFFKSYNMSPVDSIPTFYGYNVIYAITSKK